MFDAPSENGLTLTESRASIEVHTQESPTTYALARSEIEAQLDAAHKYPRSITQSLRDAVGMATLSREVAESCMYALPRGGKSITGPSVRLAEIMAGAWGNLQFGSRVLDATDRDAVAQGYAWDTQKNNRVQIEARRPILDKYGKRFKDDMVGVTGAAAASVALRNAIFKVIPRAYVDTVYAAARACAVGDMQTLDARRSEIVGRLQKGGIALERILARVEKKGVDDIGLEELETLVGLLSSLRQKLITPDEAFPPVDQTATKAAALSEAVKASRKAEPQPEPVAIKADENGVIHEESK